jgi:hypothetical protein
MLTMLGDIVEEPLDERGLSARPAGRLHRRHCLGIFNSFPYVYVQNIAFGQHDGVRSRFVCAGAAMIMICLAFCPRYQQSWWLRCRPASSAVRPLSLWHGCRDGYPFAGDGRPGWFS